MTSRERVRTVLNGEIPDRVPIDIGGSISTGIHVDEYIAIADYLKLDAAPPKVYDQFQMLARIDDPMMKWFASDVAQVENTTVAWGLRNKNWKMWESPSGNGVLMPGDFEPIVDEKGYIYIHENNKPVARMSPSGRYFDRYWESSRSFDEDPISPEAWKKSIPLYTDEELGEIQARASYLHRYTEYALFGGFLRAKLGTTGIFAGYALEEWFYIMLADKNYAYELLQATAEKAIENLKLYLEACGEYIDVILMSTSDYGTQRGPMFNPNLFDELFVPNYKLVNDYAHKHSKAKTFYHCCGSIKPLIPGYIACGADIMNPIQTNAVDMNPKELKEKFGKQIVFWGGGMDVQKLLPYGTEEEIRSAVMSNMLTLKEGGNYVFAATHNIQVGIAPRNIELAIKTALEFADY